MCVSVCVFAGRIGVRAVLGALRALGVRSLMVEGGASVIRSFLHAAREQDGHDGGGGEAQEKCVDALVVTVAPTVVGDAGVGYGGGLRAEEVSVRTTPLPEPAGSIGHEAHHHHRHCYRSTCDFFSF